MSPLENTTQSQSLLDVILTTNKELICDSGVLLYSMSDHSAIYCFCKSSLKNQPRYFTYRDMNKFRCEQFNLDLHFVPWLICTVFDDVDDQCYAWYTLFMEIADRHAPLKTKRYKKRRVPWMNAEIKELMWQCDQTHRIAIKTKDEQLFQLYKCIRNNVTSELRKAKKEYLYYLLTKESSTPQAFWKNVKQAFPAWLISQNAFSTECK